MEKMTSESFHLVHLGSVPSSRKLRKLPFILEVAPLDLGGLPLNLLLLISRIWTYEHPFDCNRA